MFTHPFLPVLFLCSMGAAVVSTAAPRVPMPKTQSVWAIAEARWKNDETRLAGSVQYAPASGTFTLGPNTARIGMAMDVKPLVTHSYAPFRAESLHAQSAAGANSAEALSLMLTRAIAANGQIPYRISVAAVVKSEGSGSGGYSAAQGHDPQYIVAPGILEGTLALERGSVLFARRINEDGAWTRYEMTAPLLAGPLVSIEVQTLDGGLEATVRFAVSKNLTFFDPRTSEPITEVDVERIIEEDPELGTEYGLSYPLVLLVYSYDLTGLPLCKDAAVGASAASIAQSPDFGEPKKGGGDVK